MKCRPKLQDSVRALINCTAEMVSEAALSMLVVIAVAAVSAFFPSLPFFLARQSSVPCDLFHLWSLQNLISVPSLNFLDVASSPFGYRCRN